MRPAPIAHRGEIRVLRHRNRTVADMRAMQRAAERGTVMRLRSGAYVPSRVWSSLSLEEQERLSIAAAFEASRGGFVASHRSAGALWGAPMLHLWDHVVDVRTSVGAGSRTEHGQRKHATADVDLHRTEIDGIPCTTLERTVVDIAVSAPFADAVVVADWALRSGAQRDALRRVLDEARIVRGRRRAESVIGFADPGSASAGESWSRVQIADGGLRAPVLQAEFRDDGGLIGYVDFYWPEFGVIGEFDGLQKYLKEEFRGGRAPGEVVVDEKRREDRLRGTGPTVTRWIWHDLRRRGALVQQLRAVGVRD